MFTEQRQAVRAGGAKAGPGADAVELGQAWHVIDGALQHLRQHPRFDFRVGGIELPRGADEQLAGWAWLDIGGGRRASGVVRAGDVTQLHRSDEHTSELQSLMRISYAVFCLKKKN